MDTDGQSLDHVISSCNLYMRHILDIQWIIKHFVHQAQLLFITCEATRLRGTWIDVVLHVRPKQHWAYWGNQTLIEGHYPQTTVLSSSSSCSWRVRCVSFSLILKMKLVPPSLLRSSYVPSSFWSIPWCLFWYSICIQTIVLYSFNFFYFILTPFF